MRIILSFSPRDSCVLEKSILLYYVTKHYKFTWEYIFGNNRIWLSHGDIKRLDFDGMFSFVRGFFSNFFSCILSALYTKDLILLFI